MNPVHTFNMMTKEKKWKKSNIDSKNWAQTNSIYIMEEHLKRN